MTKTEIAPGIIIYTDVLSGHEGLVSEIEDAVSLNAAHWVDASVQSGSENGVNKSTRDTQTIGIPYSSNPQEDLSNSHAAFNSSLGLIFFNAFDPIEKDYMRSYGIDAPWHDQYGILKYGAGQKFTNHIDDHQSYHRRISTVYYINEDYSGGEINFPRFGITHKPKSNEMLVFPSTYVYNHSVSPVVDGTRYSVVSWLR